MKITLAFSYVSKILQDYDGVPSSKRWVAFICLMMVVATWASNLYYGKTITEFIYDSLVYLIIGCLGISGVEKFVPKKKPTPQPDDAGDSGSSNN